MGLAHTSGGWRSRDSGMDSYHPATTYIRGGDSRDQRAAVGNGSRYQQTLRELTFIPGGHAINETYTVSGNSSYTGEHRTSMDGGSWGSGSDPGQGTPSRTSTPRPNASTTFSPEPSRDRMAEHVEHRDETPV